MNSPTTSEATTRGNGKASGVTPVIRIENAGKAFGDVAALVDVTLDIYENEFFALLGPSGCGKTTLLRSIGGFEELTSGRILVDGRDLGDSKPYERPVNMMFQSYALFPHMNVRDNIAYGLKAEKLPKSEIAKRVNDVVRTVDLEELVERRPNQLSGGQRQRVALARAIVKRPRVLLLDEPLAALDRKLRQEMQIELKRLQHEVGLTFIVVTHDQEEAMTMANRVAVMNAGQVLQVDSPQDLYAKPRDHFVAAFIGKMNFLPGKAGPGGVVVDGVGLIPADVEGYAEGDSVWLAVRPESSRLGARRPTDRPAAKGIVEGVAFIGSQVHTHVTVDGGHGTFVITEPPEAPTMSVGAEAWVTWDSGAARILPRS